MSTSSLTRAYATLGLQPGCSWEEVRQQHKRLAFTWHPDRHISTPDPAQIEERAKEINAAFDVLSDYYRARRRATEEAPKTNSPLERPAWQAQHYSAEKLRVPGTRSTGTYVLAAVGIAAMVFWILSRLATEPSTEITSNSIADASDSPDASNLIPYDELSQPGAAGQFDQLRVGASTQEVLQGIGVPGKVDGNVWHYDAGQIVFRNGVVTHWQAVAGSRPDSALPLDGIDERVTYGSTRADVRRILGAPAAEGDAQWTYGPSQIYFRNDRVSGWYLSPLQPLKVRE